MNPYVIIVSMGTAVLGSPEFSIKYPYDYLDAVICAFSSENLKPDYCTELEEIVKKIKEQEEKK